MADAGNYLLRRVAPAGLYAPEPAALAARTGAGAARRGRWRCRPLPWPVDPQFEWHELAGNMGEARGSLADARERFHAGIDVHANEGEIVRAVASGKVECAARVPRLRHAQRERVGRPVHLRARPRRTRAERASRSTRRARPSSCDEAGRPLRVRVRRGTRFELGDAIGTVNRFNHVHLNVGTPGREVNPLLLPLVGFVDTVPPTIAPRGIILLTEAG